MSGLIHRPEDQVFTLQHVAAKEGEPIVLGEHDEILAAEYDAPYFYLVVRSPWYPMENDDKETRVAGSSQQYDHGTIFDSGEGGV